MLPKTVEHAIKILVCLALSVGTPISASTVAQSLRIPPSQTAKILHYLSLRGLTRSRRGSSGGYSLRESPEQISVGRVTELFQPSPDEGRQAFDDPLLQIWSETSDRYEHEWHQLTIAELARRTAGKWQSSKTTSEVTT